MAVASPEIGAAELAGVVRTALGAPDATLGAWTVTPLTHRIINGITGGLWRVAGTAEVNGAARGWSVIIKSIGGLAGDLTSPFAPTAAPGHWNYWRREPLVYDSGLLDTLPAGLRAPRSYGTAMSGPHGGGLAASAFRARAALVGALAGGLCGGGSAAAG